MFRRTPEYLSLPYTNTQPFGPLGNSNSLFESETSNNFSRNNRLVNSMLNNRIDKLSYEKEILNKIHNPYEPPVNPHYHGHNHNSLSGCGHHIMYPNYYYYDISIPIYHPMELPKMCAPVAPPRFATGGPVKEKHCCHKGNAMDILLLLTQIGKIPPVPEKPKEKSRPGTPEEIPKKEKIPKNLKNNL